MRPKCQKDLRFLLLLRQRLNLIKPAVLIPTTTRENLGTVQENIFGSLAWPAFYHGRNTAQSSKRWLLSTEPRIGKAKDKDKAEANLIFTAILRQDTIPKEEPPAKAKEKERKDPLKEHGTLESGGTTDEQHLMPHQGHIYDEANLRSIWSINNTRPNDNQKMAQGINGSWRLQEFRISADLTSLIRQLAIHLPFWHLPGYPLGTRVSPNSGIKAFSEKIIECSTPLQKHACRFLFRQILLTASLQALRETGVTRD